MHDENDPKDGTVGYGKPPVDTQFKKGQSGNPKGRPPKSISRRALIERVLGEKHRLNNQPKGERVLYTGLELIIMTVKQLAASGHQQATKLFTGLMEKYGRQDPINQEIGYLVVPERLTIEEWKAKYAPKDEPPEEEPFS